MGEFHLFRHAKKHLPTLRNGLNAGMRDAMLVYSWMWVWVWLWVWDVGCGCDVWDVGVGCGMWFYGYFLPWNAIIIAETKCVEFF